MTMMTKMKPHEIKIPTEAEKQLPTVDTVNPVDRRVTRGFLKSIKDLVTKRKEARKKKELETKSGTKTS